MKAEYQTFIDVPQHLVKYLSLNLLNQDYWNNCVDKQTQQQLEQQTRNWLNLDLAPYETHYNIETKIDDISTDLLPIVPKLCDKQGFIFIWTVPLWIADSVSAQALQFKTELQNVKSTVADDCETLIAQVHIYNEFVFVSSVKYYNFVAKYPKHRRLELCRMVWQTLIDVFDDKTIYAVNGGVLNQAHNLFNGKNIQREPYRRKVLKSLGFEETTVAAAPTHFYLHPTEKIWKYEHQPSAQLSL